MFEDILLIDLILASPSVKFIAKFTRASARDLDNCWSVVAEAIQTILRREAYPHPYEALKALTRTNQAITENSIKEFIEELNVNEDIKKELRAITPHTYTGL